MLHVRPRRRIPRIDVVNLRRRLPSDAGRDLRGRPRRVPDSAVRMVRSSNVRPRPTQNEEDFRGDSLHGAIHGRGPVAFRGRPPRTGWDRRVRRAAPLRGDDPLRSRAILSVYVHVAREYRARQLVRTDWCEHDRRKRTLIRTRCSFLNCSKRYSSEG